MSQLRTYAVTHALHILPCGQLVDGASTAPIDSTATRTLTVQALSADGAIDMVERDTRRIVTWAQRVPCPSTPAHAARAVLAKSTQLFGVGA